MINCSYRPSFLALCHFLPESSRADSDIRLKWRAGDAPWQAGNGRKGIGMAASAERPRETGRAVLCFFLANNLSDREKKSIFAFRIMIWKQ